MFRFFSHILLSGLILLSITGVTVNLHYCQDGLYDIALSSPAENCCENGAHDHPCHQDSNMDKPIDCEDETVKVESTDDFFVSSYSFDFNNNQIIDLFHITSLFSENRGTTKITSSKVPNFKIPLVPPEVVLSQVQSFLI
jgi:hypothetical protein